jgi:hypothetical protein
MNSLTQNLVKADDNGTVIYDRNGVQIYKYGDGSEVGIDNSGKGAVLCVWNIYVGLKAYLDTCVSDRDKEFRADLGKGIDRIEQFIVENSLTTVSKSDLEARKRSELAGLSAMSPSQIEAMCSATPDDTTYGVYASFRSALTSEKLKAAIANLLSIPRLPVMNPCL